MFKIKKISVKILAFILAFQCMGLFFTQKSFSEDKPAMDSLQFDNNVSITLPEKFTLEETQMTCSKYTYMKRTNYYYSVIDLQKNIVGKLNITKDFINGNSVALDKTKTNSGEMFSDTPFTSQKSKDDVITYVKFIPVKSDDITLSINNIHLNSKVMNSYYDKNNALCTKELLVKDAPKNSFENTSLFLNNNFWIEKSYYTKDMGYKVYDKQPITSSFTFKNNQLQMKVPYKKDYAINFAFLSSAGNNIINLSSKDAAHQYSNLDLCEKCSITPEGFYDSESGSYRPWSKTAIWRNPSAIRLTKCVSYFDISHFGDFFKDMSLSLMYSYAADYNSSGYIPTIPYCTWLYDDTGIHYNFYDTRFNSDTATALITMYKSFPDAFIKETLENYVSFFKTQVYGNGFTTKNGGYFVPDYYSESNSLKTKPGCALNHLIAEMAVLYDYYLYVKPDGTIYYLAGKMRQAVMDTYTSWIKPNGDLWYRISPDGTFSGTDYPTLTYDDLTKICKVFANPKIYKRSISEFEYLRDSKLKWIKANNIK